MRKWIAVPHVEGLASRQAHADLPAGTVERELGKEGFFGPVSVGWASCICPPYPQRDWWATLRFCPPYACYACWPGYGPQRQRSLDAASGDYVFTIDADERVTPELRQQVDAELAKETVPCAVYKMPWGPIFFGARLRFGGRYASPQARLFRREGAQFPMAQVHETLKFPPGPIGNLSGRLDHDSYRSYKHMVDKHTEYAWLLAKEKLARGKRTFLLAAPLRFAWEFILQYLLRGLILDGRRGFLLANLLSQYAYHKYAALYTMQLQGDAPDPKFAPELRQRR